MNSPTHPSPDTRPQSWGDQPNRRHFLGQAAATGAVASLSLVAQRALAESSPSNRIVVGVMGLSRGRSLAVSFAKQPNVEVKYVCDVDAERAASGIKLVQGAGYKAPQATGDFRQILDDKEVDALVCAAPNHWHAPATIMACNAGKHVYVEKPCSHNPQEGEWMIQAARKNNKAVQVGTQRRSGAGMFDAVNKLREGVIGNVYCSRSWYFNQRPPTGERSPAEAPSNLDYQLWQGPAPRQPYMTNQVHYKWHWFWHWGNGELGNNGVHTLDICRWGLGVDYPIRVVSAGGRYHYHDDQETPDTHNALFEFEGGKMIGWQGHSCNKHGHNKFVVFYGDNGTMEVDSNGSFIVYDRQDKRVDEKSSPSRGDTEHIENLLTAIRQDKPLELNAEVEEGHKSTLLCHLGNIAYQTGRTLNCDPSNGHIMDDSEAMQLWQRDYEDGWKPQV